ncbi:SusE domain-containing protein [Lacinutrix sp. MedPE-SW]|uniref:SusE domain-containing protein n=1 Tax=Lacinutrix sp. MedPE-SW TaxID=1860087 RepID=UPI00091E26EF|nr:SusE domain-containing protein [Lacinutrix sp. MedPE-SW]OIQ23205.1 MAG: hypothetical protein BM549_04110 [Lacinutrix sp. MedPE-SW]
MKNFIKISALFIAILVGFTSCEDDEKLEFIAAPQGEFELTNTFLSEYVLPAESTTDNNIGAVFAFNPADFDIQTNISYELQSSINGDFSDATVVNTLSSDNNQIDVSIGTLKTLAEEYGIIAPDSGVLNFRVRAFPGDSSSSTEVFTPIQQILVTLLEEQAGGSGSGIEPVSWGIVGSGYNNWGAYEDQTFYSTSESNVFVTYATLLDGEIKFRENDDWASDFGDDGADGTLDAGGANIVVTAGTYKITMNLNDNTYTIEPFSWGVVGSGYNDWGASPDAKFYYDYVTDTFKVGVRLVDGEIKFRQNNEWTTDFGDSGADGTLDAGGDNIVVTAGHYTITLDFNASTYTIEAADLYGIVGSGYNDWGATQDFTLTPLSNDIWVGDIVNLVNGEIKFRVNDAWDTDFGDTGADGTLDAGGDNIAVTAGSYRVKLDIANGTYAIN